MRLLEEPGAGHAVFVAEGGDGVVGWVSVTIELRLEPSPSAMTGGLVVDEAHRGARLGDLVRVTGRREKRSASPTTTAKRARSSRWVVEDDLIFLPKKREIP